MFEKDIEISLDEIEGVNITQEDIRELEQNINELADVMKAFEKLLEEHMESINDSQVYNELGVELVADAEFDFSVENKEQ